MGELFECCHSQNPGVLCLALFCLICFPAAAADQTQADAASKWGLIGTWAISCGEPSSPGNPFYSYVRKGNALVLTRKTGKVIDTNDVISAKILNENEIELITDFKKFSKVMTSHFVRIDKDKFSLSFNVDDKGIYTIQDGKLTKDGSPAPIMKRC